jgi:P-type Cu+ transporter
MNKKVTLKITGMHCMGCAQGVEKALKGVSGVSAASVNLQAAKASVEFDSDKTSENDLLKAVKVAGFGAAV